MKSKTNRGHIKDNDNKKNPSYQQNQQDMRQGPTHDKATHTRSELGFENRDTTGYDREHKGNY